MEQTATGSDTAGFGVPQGGCLPAPEAAGMDVANGLVQLSSMIQGIYARVSEAHELTAVQAKLLCVLLDGSRGMAELAHCFGVEKAALTGLMNRAERRGLAERQPVPGDRRAVQVTLTGAGRTAALAFHAEVTAALDRLTGHLPAGEMEAFRATMADIVGRGRAAGAAERGPAHG